MTDSTVTTLADEYWSFHRASAQLWNIDRGDVDQIEHWEDFSVSGTSARIEQLQRFSARSAELLPCASAADRVLLNAVGFSARAMADQLPYVRDITFVAGVFNLTTVLGVLVPGYSLTRASEGRGFVAKLRGVPQFIDGWMEGLRDGRATGRCATARGVGKLIDELGALLAGGAAADPLAGQDSPSELSEGEAVAWSADVLDAIEHSVHPALARVRGMLLDEIVVGARSDDECGLCHLPDGDEGYRRLLVAATSTDLTAEEIHEIGRRELERLDEQYREWGSVVVAEHDPSEIRRRLRDDSRFRYSNTDQLVADATAALARARAAVPEWFDRLPASDCEVVLAHSGPLAYYSGPSPDGVRGGVCYFNISDPAMWTSFGLEATMFHESIPGHHLQLALAQELDLHPVVSELEVTGYGEGWGLYAERLADDMGLYTGPLQRLGMLTLDSLRAARLVVDTGLHAMGWSRDHAIEVMLASTALERPNATSEVDRYIADPGQATSYMIGRLEFDRLRAHARSRLGDRFSMPAFHQAVLGGGMMPLTGLTEVVDRWIERDLRRPGDA